MRRGHAGIGGWRNENTRHFRPRTGVPPHFRYPPRNYALLDSPRFPPPGQRHPRGPPPFKNHQNQVNNRSTSDHQDRNKYRHDNRQTNQYRQPERSHNQNQRPIFPIFDRMRQGNDAVSPQFGDNYYDNTPRESSHVNSLGDIDHRQQGNLQRAPDPHGRHSMPTWINHPEIHRSFYDDRNNYNKQQKHHDSIESNKIPVLEYTGHRPPASDHYGGNPGSSIDNSNSFSRSVDDTVDIIRKRLQNRNEPQPLEPIDHHDEDLRIPSCVPGSYQNVVQEQPPKKRIQRQKQDRSSESNCDKMKSKIVQQLFRMDKDRIHKLMDNPSSSSKFEYAISSLITESQNSLNKHLRSVAEKSLSSSEDFIHNDNNTIYEDTFMKQMQHILEPQDTVLLEDIKPLVLAELSKVLQLNEYDQPFQVVDDQQNYHQIHEQPNYNNYSSEFHNYENYSHNQNSYYDHINSPPVGYEDYGNSNADLSQLEYDQPEPEKPQPLFHRRSPKKSHDHRPEPSFSPVQETLPVINTEAILSREEVPSFTNERRLSRRSIDSKQSEEKNKEPEPLVPLFDTNVTQLSEEEDPFAELDKQYHVAVDHNFIDTDAYGGSSPQQPLHDNSRSSSKSREFNNKTDTSTKEPFTIKQEVDNQLHNSSSSPFKLQPVLSSNRKETGQTSSNNVSMKKEVVTPTKDKANSENECLVPVKQESHTESGNLDKSSERTQNIHISPKATVSSSSRKRSTDQKPAHRKEKRKKSEPPQTDSSQQTLNKNIINNVNDCATKDKEKVYETAKSIFNLYFSKNGNDKELAKDTKKVDVDKSYSDKYVKRKETHRKSKDKDEEQKKRQRTSSTSHSIVSPKDNNNTQSSKTDAKTKLQSIDMFLEQPKKVTAKHQAHRNTALPPNTPTKPVEIIKTKQPLISFNRKITKRHVSTQSCCKTFVKETQTEIKSCTSRSCQTDTDKKKMVDMLIQTDPVSTKKCESKATDAFERMKEIDMEIQVLLQEKFKLYSSLESNTTCPSTIQTLGMTVLNVPFNETDENNSQHSLSGDAIVDDFTNIPVEELEQIALESVEQPERNPTTVVEKKTRRHKISEASRASSASPTVKRSARRTVKTPNISLLEQIITDDRPLEDIISLDDLETTPVKGKKKLVKQQKKKRNRKAAPKMVKTQLPLIANITEHDLKECYVVLQREDFSRFSKPMLDENSQKNLESTVTFNSNADGSSLSKDKTDDPDIQVFNESDVVETVVENDLQFDMLDVSEDIVIGDVCEVKSGDKEVERTELAITEDIILDNSQSSVELVQTEGGSGENICKMYDYSTDENLRRDAVTVSGHADAVLAIECIENNFVAACLDGNVYCFSSDGQLQSTLRGSNFAVTCLTIVKEKYGTTVYTGSLDSRIRYYDLETGLEKGPECNVLSPIQTMDRAWDTIFVGTRTGFVLQFECKNNMLIPVSTVKFADQSILALRAMKEGPRKVLLVAARSEDVTIKDAQTGLLLRTLQGPKMTVYTLLYEDGKVYCGTSSHLVHVFDYASGSHVGAHEGGKGAVCLRASGGLLFVGCYDGCVYIYREGESRPLAQLRGPRLMLLSLAIVGSKIIAGYKDRSLYIWKIPLSILQEMIL